LFGDNTEILFVDDEPGILEQAKIFLEDLNKKININTVSSAEHGLMEINKNDYDSIISDYQMSGMDGLDFLREIRARGINIPFIMFTGRGREEVAIKALNLGANNYIQKGGNPRVQFELLADVIDQEVRLYRGEKARFNLASIVESSQNAIISKDLDGYIKSWNKGAEQIYGYTEDEVIGKHISIITPEGSEKEIDDILDTVRKGKKVKPYETVRKTKEGGEIHISLTVSPIENKEGSVIGASAIAQDITERKEAEDRILHLNLVLDSIRNVNQTIIRETDKERLIDEICNILVENRGYKFSWIVIFDENDEIDILSYSTLDEKRSDLLKEIEKEGLPRCVNVAMNESGVRIFEKEICDDCISYQGCERDKNLAVRLEYEEDIFGVLIVALPKNISVDEDEINLLEEVAGDISFALYSIEMKEKIEEGKKRSEKIIDSMLDGFIVFDSEGVQTYVNDAFCRMTGFTKSELTNKKIPMPYWPENKPEKIQDILSQVTDGKFKDHEICLKRKDSSEFPAIISPKAITDSSGKYSTYFASVKDISERKKQEDELRDLNERLEVLLKNIPGMAYKCKNDRNWTMELVSEGSYKLTGYRSEELIDNEVISYGELIHPDHREYVWNSVNRSIQEKKPFKIIYKIIDKSGDEKWVWEQGRADYSDEGEIDEVEGLIMDITERKELEDKQKFLHTLLRHDLKNKVNIIHGYLQLLENEPGDIGIIKKAIEATKKEMNLIEKVRILSKISDEVIKPMNLDSILDTVLSEFMPTSMDKGIEIKFEKSGLEVMGGVLLEDLFGNIIENSIIHSGGDKIEIGVKDESEEIIVNIEDNGKGVDGKYKNKIFKKSFSAGENAGTGLGMYLSKEIVENYGGQIDVKESSLGGARFDIHLKKVR